MSDTIINKKTAAGILPTASICILGSVCKKKAQNIDPTYVMMMDITIRCLSELLFVSAE